MQQILNFVLNKIKANFIIFIALLVTFLVGFILGLFFSLPEVFSELYKTFVLEVFTNVLLNKVGIINYFLIRLLNLLLLYLIVFLLALFSISFYGIFILVFYRAYVLSVALKICAITLNFGGIIPFIFTVFIESLICTFSIIIYAVLCYNNQTKKDGCFFNKRFKKTAICLILGTLGIVLECLLLICIFRPINFYF